jgi:hypothetical protein
LSIRISIVSPSITSMMRADSDGAEVVAEESVVHAVSATHRHADTATATTWNRVDLRDVR